MESVENIFEIEIEILILSMHFISVEMSELN